MKVRGVLLGALLPAANPPGTSAEDVVVFTAEHGPRAGRDIAVAGIQVCGGPRTDTSLLRGLQVWDVTNPAGPEELALLDTGCRTRGLHELKVEHRPDLGQTFVHASDMNSGLWILRRTR